MDLIEVNSPLETLDTMSEPTGMSTRISRFLAETTPPTPCLIIDLAMVAQRYHQLQAALPESTIYYAVKANPEPEIIETLGDCGSRFDVASPAEIDQCLAVGISPDRLSYGNTIKKATDIAYAHRVGVTLFAFDSHPELRKIAQHAPGARVFCRLLASGEGADWPLSRKFGCDPDMAVDLLLEADQLGLDAWGLSFHVGSQQRDPGQWEPALALASRVAVAVSARSGGSVQLRGINIGGGFPAHYIDAIPAVEVYAAAIRDSFERHFPVGGPAGRPEMVAEPGRYVVADAGVLQTEVILVSQKSYDDTERWVYLDAGVFGGLAETLGEAIKYRLATTCDGGSTGPVVLAGPTCDSMDVMYERHRYELPLELEAGDKLTVLAAGAYTKAYCTDGFNGFQPMPAYCLR